MKKDHKWYAAASLCGSLLVAGAFVSGCTMAPKYEQPESQVAMAFPLGDSEAGGGMSAADMGWREFFGDERLQRIIAIALENNRDLRVAALRVEQVRAQYQIQRSALFPSVGASGDGSRQRIPADLATGSPTAVYSDQFSVGVGVTSYELDFFGRVRSLKDAALQSYLATEQAQKSAHMSIVASVAMQYLFERSCDEQLELTRQTLKLVEDSHKLIKNRYDAGAASELDLKTSEAQWYTAQANLSEYTRQRELAKNALVLLMGCPMPEDLPAPKPLGKQALKADMPSGLPSDLLLRRPDIVQAEHELRSANANIGAARANFFPSISLTAFGGTASADLDGLFKAGSATWSFAPSITLPIFTGGRNKATLESAKASQQMAVAQYDKAVQTAFREVADALASRVLYVDQVNAREKMVEAEQRRYDLSETRYKQGVDNYLTVLTAQQNLFAAQQGLIQTHYAQLSNLISLYKALGGGWLETNQDTRVADNKVQ